MHLSKIKKHINLTPYIFFGINIYFFHKYHGIFVYGISNEINFIQQIIKLSNWIFGFAFLPFAGQLFIHYKNKNKYKFIYTIILIISCDIFLAYFQKAGSLGFVCQYFTPQPKYLLISLIPIFATSWALLQKKPIIYKTKKTKKIIIKEVAEKSDLPSAQLLTVGKKIPLPTNNDSQKQKLKQVLIDFGIDAKLMNVQIGPVITLFSVELAPGIKANRLINLADDIARSMHTHSARIAIIPGKNLIGIEVSNEKRQTIYFKEGITSSVYQNFNGQLPLYLGSNIYGEHEVVDLSKMPHLLIAGTTGSGKSVGIHTMLLSLLYKLSPKEFKLIMVDPKKLELTPYEEIPHLLLPVITQAKKAITAVKWAVKEMEQRYQNMSELGVRNLLTYNAKLFQLNREEEKIPFIVIIIDEMADLMLTAGKEFEIQIQRLAQMGRAAGIHLIMATQRPSVDIITGTIKANFPTRISFKLATKLDSRTILGDMSGAEQLLGSGDMLYLSNAGKVIRVHGSFVSESDVLSVVEFWKSISKPQYIELDEDETYSANGNLEDEPYYQEAIALIKREKKVSTSFLQRSFPIGYNRAAKIIEQMERDAIISKGDSFGRNREIF